MAYSIENIIKWAKVAQFLAEKDMSFNRLMGSENVDYRLPQMLYVERKSLEWMYSNDSADKYLYDTGNYVYALCGKYIAEAKTLAAIGGGITVIPTTSAAATLKGFRIELLAGTTIAAGAISYTIGYANIIDKTVEVKTPQSNIPEGETNEFSYTAIYSQANVVINFTNDDGSGNNLGVPNGTLLIITGLYLAAA